MVSFQEFIEKSGHSQHQWAKYERRLNNFARAFPNKITYTKNDIVEYCNGIGHRQREMIPIEKYLRLNLKLIDRGKIVKDRERIRIENAKIKYLRHLKRKDYAVSTIRGIGDIFNVFVNFLGEREIYFLDEIDKTIMSAFKDYLYRIKHSRDRNYAIAYQKTMLQQLSLFFKYLVLEEYILLNPCLCLTYPREEKRVSRNFLSRNEIDDFFNVIDTSSVSGFYERTIFEVLYSTGIRIGELRHLKLNDIHLEDHLVMIIDGKGKKDRVVVLTEIARRYLETYINHVWPRYLRPGIESKYLFPTAGGKIQKRTFLLNIINRYQVIAEIGHHISPHAFRRSFATHLLNEGIDVRYIQQLMGHKSLGATVKYLKIAIKDLYEILVKFHPREKTMEHKEIIFRRDDNAT